MNDTARRELERRGVDSVRALLFGIDGQAGSGRITLVRLGDGVTVGRGEMEDWLRQKERTSHRRIKTRAIAAIAGAIAAVVAAVLAAVSIK